MVGRILLPFMSLYPVVPVAICLFLSAIYLPFGFCFFGFFGNAMLVFVDDGRFKEMGSEIGVFCEFVVGYFFYD